MIESVAIARKINAQAVAQEIQNSIDYVDAYFKRRELNRQWRAKENPNHLESEKHRQEVLERLVKELYPRGDKTETLNWLLQELSRPVVSYQYLLGGKSLVQPELDAKLTARDLQFIRLTDGGSKASRLVFAAADGNVLLPHWPFSLRDRRVRRGPRQLRAHPRGGRKGNPATGKDQLRESNKADAKTSTGCSWHSRPPIPSERRKDSKEFSDYAAGKRFVQTLLAAARRAIAINDAAVFNGSLRFQGNSLLALIQHMYQNGLEFAPPEPGGEGVYETLYKNLRTLYISMEQERQHAAEGQEDAAPRHDKGVRKSPENREDPKGDRAT